MLSSDHKLPVSLQRPNHNQAEKVVSQHHHCHSQSGAHLSLSHNHRHYVWSPSVTILMIMITSLSQVDIYMRLTDTTLHSWLIWIVRTHRNANCSVNLGGRKLCIICNTQDVHNLLFPLNSLSLSQHDLKSFKTQTNKHQKSRLQSSHSFAPWHPGRL